MNALHFAVVVGLDHYRDPPLPPLRHARRDAQRFIDWLRTGGGVPAANVVPVSGEGKREPTLAEVFDALYEVCERARAVVKKSEEFASSRLYFFASGHGVAPEGQDAALVGAEAKPGRWPTLSTAKLIDFLAESQDFREVVVFADCCRDRFEDAPSGAPPWNRRRTDRGGITWFAGYATRYDRKAFEAAPAQGPGGRNGYFTEALLEALSEPRGRVDSVGIQARIKARMVQLVPADLDQVPMFPTNGGGTIVFREEMRAVGLAMTVQALGAGAVTVYDGSPDRVQVQVLLEPGPWTVELPAGLYEFERDGHLAMGRAGKNVTV